MYKVLHVLRRAFILSAFLGSRVLGSVRRKRTMASPHASTEPDLAHCLAQSLGKMFAAPVGARTHNYLVRSLPAKHSGKAQLSNGKSSTGSSTNQGF